MILLGNTLMNVLQECVTISMLCSSGLAPSIGCRSRGCQSRREVAIAMRDPEAATRLATQLPRNSSSAALETPSLAHIQLLESVS